MNSFLSKGHRKEWSMENIYSFLIAFLLIGSIYIVSIFGVISYGEILIIVFDFLLLFKHKTISLFSNVWLLAFTLYSVVLTLIVSLFLGGYISEPISRLARDAFYWVNIYVIAKSFLNYSIFEKWVLRLCVALSVFIIIQSLVYYLTGIVIPGMLVNVTVSTSESVSEIYDHLAVMAQRNGYFKANGFLKEAAHCAQALFIGNIIIFERYKVDYDSRNLRLAILFSVASIMTFSASALVFVLCFWSIVCFDNLKMGRISKKMAIPFLFFLIGALFFSLFLDVDLNFSGVIERITTASSANTADGSSYYRIYRGFYYWATLPIQFKLFGIGFGNYDNFQRYFHLDYNNELMNEYMNSISYLLVSSGVIGIVFFFLFIYYLFRDGTSIAKYTIIGLLIMSLSSSPYSSVFWIWLMLIIINNQKHNPSFLVSEVTK